MRPKKQKGQLLPQIKKEIKDFLSNEEGRVVKKNVLKMGLALTVLGAALSGMMKPDESQAQGVCSHASHASHGHHSRGGWC